MRLSSTNILSLGVVVSAIVFSIAVGFAGEADPRASRPVQWVVPILAVVLFSANGIAAVLLRRRERRSAVSATEPGAWRVVEGATVLGLTLMGLVLRVAHLDAYAFGNDEILFVSTAGFDSLAETVRHSLIHFHPPANFVLLHSVLKISWDPFWVRFPSVLGGTLAIPGIWLFVRRLFGPRAAVMSAFLLTFSPSMILLSQVCRNYSPSFPFFLLSLYLLMRYLESRRASHVCGFGLFELLSVIWHYAYLPVYLGMNLLLFVRLLRWKANWKEWVRCAAVQLPVAAVFLFGSLVHQPLTHSPTQSFILGYMSDEYFLAAGNPMKPLVGLYAYLLGGSPEFTTVVPGTFLFVIALAGGYFLWKSGYRWAVGMCLAFIPFSYLFAFGLHLLPFGGTRHSFYAVPFALALLTGGLSWVIRDERDEPYGGGPDKGSRMPLITGRRRIPALVLILVLGLGFVFQSMKMYVNVTPYYLRQNPAFYEALPFYKPQFYKVAELPVRSFEIEAFRESVLRETREGEVIVGSLPTIMILNAHLRERPQGVKFDLHEPIEFDWKARRFLYLPEAQFVFTPDSLLVTVSGAARRYGLQASDRVWVARLGWEAWLQSLSSWSALHYPSAVGEEAAIAASLDTLFAVKVGEATVRSQGVVESAPLSGGSP